MAKKQLKKKIQHSDTFYIARQNTPGIVQSWNNSRTQVNRNRRETREAISKASIMIPSSAPEIAIPYNGTPVKDKATHVSYIGGDRDAARKAYWEEAPIIKAATDSIAGRYGINPELLRNRLNKEGFTDHAIANYNAINIYVPQESRDAMRHKVLSYNFINRDATIDDATSSFGLDDAATYINSGLASLINERWQDTEFKNEKGRETHPASGITGKDNMGIMAAVIKGFRNQAAKDFPNATSEELDNYANIYYNRGITGGRNYINNGNGSTPYTMAEGGPLQTHKTWNELSMKDRADVMKLFIDRGIYDLDTIKGEYNKFAEGGGIHIDPSKRGTFTAAASRHNMGVQEFASKVLANKDDYSAAMVKKANFARNASKWHAYGGNIYDGDTEPTQQMQQGYIRQRPEGTYFYDVEGQPEIDVTPLNTSLSNNPADWSFTDASGKIYSPHRDAVQGTGELREGNQEGPILSAVNNYLRELNWRAKNDPASIALQGKYTMPAIASTGLLPWLGEAAATTNVAGVPLMTWADAGLTAGFGAHGLNHLMKDGINGWGDAAMTALEVAPLGRLAKPIYEVVVQPGMRLFNSPLTGNWTKIGNREYRLSPSSLGTNGIPLESKTPQITAENATSITPEQWTAAQDAAIIRGDMAEAQRLRDLHFKVSAPNTKVNVPLWTSSEEAFNSFDLSHFGETDSGFFGYGHYLTPMEKYAATYHPVNRRFYVNMENPYIGSNDQYFNRIQYVKDRLAKRKENIMRNLRDGKLTNFSKKLGINENTPLEEAEHLVDKYIKDETVKWNNKYVKYADEFEGKDGVLSWRELQGIPNKQEGIYKEVVVPNGEQIKSADAVTYDDKGVRVPLGKRDNFNINDIRYGLLPFGIGLTGYGILGRDR